MVRGAGPSCTESSSSEATTLDAEPSLTWTAKCSDGNDANKLAALHGQRGYMMFMTSATANDDAEDRRIFEGFRESFHYTS